MISRLQRSAVAIEQDEAGVDSLKVLIVLFVAVLLVFALYDRNMVDDAFIHLRVVKQIEAGHGPVFNAGERVEASTSPAWTWLLVVLDLLLPLRLEWIAVLTGIGLTLSGLAFAMMGSAELWDYRRSGTTLAPAGVLVFCSVSAVWIDASTGLENGLVYAWLGLTFLILARWSRRERAASRWQLVALGFGPLIRPELLLWSIAFLGLVALCEGGRSGIRRWLRVLCWGLVLPFAYEIFRMGYYASLEPNSAIAKEATKSYWSSGWTYFSQTVNPYWLWVPFAILGVLVFPLAIVACRRDRNVRAVAIIAVFVVGALANALFVVRVGGDIFHARLLLTPFFALLAPVMVVPWRRAFFAAVVLLSLWAVIACAGLRSSWDTTRTFSTRRNPITTQDFSGFTFGEGTLWSPQHGVYDFPITNRLDIAKPLDATPLPGKDPSVAAYGIGALGYVLGPHVYVLDLLGLGDSFTAHLELGKQRGPLVAHEKPLPPPWIVARLVAPPNTLSAEQLPFPGGIIGIAEERLDPPNGEPFDQRVAQARAALNCGEIKELIDATSGGLSVGKFFSNILRSPRMTVLRIPAEPADAVARFCG